MILSLKDFCGEDADTCPVIPCPDDFAHYVQRGFGSIRSAVASSPNAALVMLDVLGKACVPISHRPRVDILRDHARMLIEQTRLALSGPDLMMVENRYREFEAATA